MNRPSQVKGRFIESVYKFVHKGMWMTMDDARLRELQKTNKGEYEYYDNLIRETQICPIRRYMPHGVRKSGKYKNDGLAMINDWRSDLILLMGPNQTGKTYSTTAWILLHGLIPLDPKWECFAENGIEYHEWTGPKICIAASWSWDNVLYLWETYKKLLPRSEIPGYAPFWGAFPGEKGGKPKEMSFVRGVAKYFDLACGSRVIFLCYTQQQIHWEGKVCDMAQLDEQCPRDKFDGLSARQLTRGDYTPIIMGLTPHVLPGRSDTGKHGWVIKDVLEGRKHFGRKFRAYKLSVQSTPDTIMSRKQKRRAFIQYIRDPLAAHDLAKIHEGRARYYGIPQAGGGGAVNEWSPATHIIEPFDLKEYDCTYYRMIDHGFDPCAALLFAVLPWQDIVIFAEYYEYGRSIPENAQAIVERLCENSREIIDTKSMGLQMETIYCERFTGMEFFATELDCRSFAMKMGDRGNRTIGQYYNDQGCACAPAAGTQLDKGIDLVRTLFAMAKKRPHINIKLNRPPPEESKHIGAPMIYVFSTCVNFRREIEQWAWEPHTKRLKGKDHLMSCLRYFAARYRPYMGAAEGVVKEEREEVEENVVCSSPPVKWRV